MAECHIHTWGTVCSDRSSEASASPNYKRTKSERFALPLALSPSEVRPRSDGRLIRGMCAEETALFIWWDLYYEREMNLRRVAPTRPKIPVLNNANVEGSGVCPVMMEESKVREPVSSSSVLLAKITALVT